MHSSMIPVLKPTAWMGRRMTRGLPGSNPGDRRKVCRRFLQSAATELPQEFFDKKIVPL